MSCKCQPIYCIICGLTLPQRYLMMFFCGIAMVVCCGQRDMFILEKSLWLVYNKQNYSYFTSTLPYHIKHETKYWSNYYILGIYPLAHYIAQIPAGILIDRYGAKWFLIGGIAFASCLTIYTPFVLGKCQWMLIMIRICLGICHSVLYPGLAYIVAQWVPYTERVTRGALVFAQYPTAATMAQITEIIYSFYWKAYFFTSGTVGFVWCVVGYMFLYDNPGSDPLICDKERDMLNELMIPKTLKYLSVRSGFLRGKSFWALVFGQIGHTYTLLLLMGGMWTYFREIFGDTLTNIIITQIVGLKLLTISTMIAGSATQYLILKKHVNIRPCRIIVTSLSFLTCNVLLILSACASDYAVLFYILYGSSIFFKGLHYAGFSVNYMDVTVNFCGTITAVTNFSDDTICTTVVVLFHLLVPYSYNIKFLLEAWIALGLSLGSSIVFLMFADSRRAKWDKSEDELMDTPRGSLYSEI
ncbi:Major Facilitator Superfamily [Popillia japonica]|uniref:Major Facilitator Superfamily n=1 Tax=Popillia japonica TaxID=7064 RepID=A0AAW1IB77_POPJA